MPRERITKALLDGAIDDLAKELGVPRGRGGIYLDTHQPGDYKRTMRLEIEGRAIFGYERCTARQLYERITFALDVARFKRGALA